jgi:hypothetical protein
VAAAWRAADPLMRRALWQGDRMRPFHVKPSIQQESARGCSTRPGSTPVLPSHSPRHLHHRRRNLQVTM